VHYAYSRPLPSKGGTDAISIYHGMVLISAATVANAGSTTCPGPGYPANYLGTIDPQSGQITALTVKGHAPAPQGLMFLG
jgi:hypothetical protein